MNVAWSFPQVTGKKRRPILCYLPHESNSFANLPYTLYHYSGIAWMILNTKTVENKLFNEIDIQNE
jgi:hypothetical protein